MQILSKQFLLPQNIKNANNKQRQAAVSAPSFKASKTAVIDSLSKEISSNIKLEGWSGIFVNHENSKSYGVYVYLDGKNIEFQVEADEDFNIMADSDKLTAVIINLVKNASEAFIIEDDALENGKYIKIKTEKEESCAKIYISNNAQGINEPEKIFNEGFTTKSSGTGLGLWICKKSIEEMMGELELSRSTEDYTEFTIRLGV